MARSKTSMSPMERVLALRTIPLFEELSTADLRRLADIAEERAFADGEVISSEGEMGDELHLVLSGDVAVTRGSAGSASVIARRGPGDVVGEMSIITRSPRVASLIAEGDVRTIRIGRQDFESMNPRTAGSVPRDDAGAGRTPRRRDPDPGSTRFRYRRPVADRDAQRELA